MTPMQVWINGSIVDKADATIRVDDHGLVVGDGAFETLKTVRGEPLAVTRHLRRLERSLSALSIAVPTDETLRHAIDACLRAAGSGEQRIRLTVTAGHGSLGSGAPDGPPTIICATTPLNPPGAPTAVTVPWTRNERGATAGLKTTSYAENVRALRAAHDAGAGEAIFANTVGHLCEGTGTNIFVVIDGECLTPSLASGCLAGVTRELVVETSIVTETDLPLEVLATADEIFLTSSTRDVQALERIDDRTLEAGPVTGRVAAEFAALIAENTDP